MSTRFAAFLSVLLLAAPAAFAAVREPAPLVPSLTRTTARVAAGESVTATFTVTNTGDETLYLLDRELPFEGFKADLFDVRRDGEPVSYRGPLYRFGPPRPVDYRAVQPGESLSAAIDLEAVYDFSRPGSYTVRFRGRAMAFREDPERGFAPLAPLRRGAALELGVERTERQVAEATSPPLEFDTRASVTPLTLGCSATQKQQILQAVPAADILASKALTALANFSGPPNDYVKWFGFYNFDNHWSAFLDFAKVQSTLEQNQLLLVCDCTLPNTFAFTTKVTQGTIHLCPLFFASPLTGFNSKADTLVHEVSHWPTWGGDTDDWAVGISASLQLAVTFFPQALDNADNFAYFSADQP